ncbi:MAG: hypothetical protein MUC88_19055, partial [Planctomycetes bacterium]|nr:hypothetical protein [Planctomycetota bacterium]
DAKRQGLLPDVFELHAQLRDGPAINPGTTQTHVPELFGKGSLYEVRRLPTHGWLVHAPCAIRDLHETKDSVTFRVDGWGRGPYSVLLAGVDRKPAAVTMTEIATDPGAPHPAARAAPTDFHAGERLLVITLSGPGAVHAQQ